MVRRDINNNVAENLVKEGNDTAVVVLAGITLIIWLPSTSMSQIVSYTSGIYLPFQDDLDHSSGNRTMARGVRALFSRSLTFSVCLCRLDTEMRAASFEKSGCCVDM